MKCLRDTIMTKHTCTAAVNSHFISQLLFDKYKEEHTQNMIAHEYLRESIILRSHLAGAHSIINLKLTLASSEPKSRLRAQLSIFNGSGTKCMGNLHTLLSNFSFEARSTCQGESQRRLLCISKL